MGWFMALCSGQRGWHRDEGSLACRRGSGRGPAGMPVAQTGKATSRLHRRPVWCGRVVTPVGRRARAHPRKNAPIYGAAAHAWCRESRGQRGHDARSPAGRPDRPPAAGPVPMSPAHVTSHRARAGAPRPCAWRPHPCGRSTWSSGHWHGEALHHGEVCAGVQQRADEGASEVMLACPRIIYIDSDVSRRLAECRDYAGAVR